MFDIGIGEIVVLAVIGLLVFGPEKLPRAAADAGRWLRQLRTMAAQAKSDLADSAGVDLNDTFDTVKSLRELHPRNLAREFMDPAPPGRQSSTHPPAMIDPDAT
jgi:sec-independent protein translocase protein TatB